MSAGGLSEVRWEMRGKNGMLPCSGKECTAVDPEGLQYSRFCEQYREWAGKLDLVMRQEHRAGEKLFIDSAGQTVPVVDPETGEVRQAQVFVAVLSASIYTVAEATWTQRLPDWTASHLRARIDSTAATAGSGDGGVDLRPWPASTRRPTRRADTAGRLSQSGVDPPPPRPVILPR